MTFYFACGFSHAEPEARTGGFQGAHEEPEGAENAETDGHAVGGVTVKQQHLLLHQSATSGSNLYVNTETLMLLPKCQLCIVESRIRLVSRHNLRNR